MQKSSEKVSLSNTPIRTMIIKFALPAILANLAGAIYNIADQIFIGQKLGTVGNAATNITFPLVLLMVMFSSMIGNGGSSRFSLYQGSGDNQRASWIVGNSLTLLAVSGIGLQLITFSFLQPLMVLFGAKGETLELAVEYTRIIAIGIPFQIFSAGSSMFVRADGSPKYAMTITLTGAILNMVFDPIFIFGFNMGITGAALATVMGQILSGVIALLYFRKFKSAALSKDSFSPHFAEIKEILILGLPAGLMQIAVMIVQIVMNNILGFYGEQSIYGRDIPLAVSGVVTKVTSIFTATLMGICQSCQPAFGYNYGARDYKRVKETLRVTAVISTVVSFASFVLFQCFPKQILEIFQKGDTLYLSFGTDYLRIFMGAIFLYGFTVLTSNFFPSIGLAREGIIASLSRQVFFQLPLIVFFPLIWGLDGVLYAGPVSDIAAALLCAALMRKVLKKMS